jgi:hypothetical protein
MDTEIKTESSTPAPQDTNAHEEASPAAPKIRGFLIVVYTMTNPKSSELLVGGDR